MSKQQTDEEWRKKFNIAQMSYFCTKEVYKNELAALKVEYKHLHNNRKKIENLYKQIEIMEAMV